MNLKSILSECWTGYKQIGMKNKGGRQVPNCVPESVTESSKDDIIKDLDKAKSDLLKKVDVLIAKKKKLYSNVDIESPMSSDEKKLDKDIADLFSELNKLVLQKRSLKESELKGYLAADVVDDIVKLIGSKFVSGEIKNAPNRNYIYLKLTDIKFGSGVVKMLKSQFGIDAKVDKTFGNIPTVSFASKKVVSEAKEYKKGDKLKIKLPNGKKFDVVFDSYSRIKGVALGKFKDRSGEYDTKPFNLDTIVESVNEAKYPTDLKIGSVIMGQGFTRLKGVDGGKYYKVVAMDDTTATLVPSDKNGNTKGSSKVRHKLDSIEGGIKTAKRGDENGIVVIKESVNEGRSIKSIQKDLDKTITSIESEIASYKKTKGTPQEKKHIDNLKKLHPIKKKLEVELDGVVSGLYRDAELKIEN